MSAVLKSKPSKPVRDRVSKEEWQLRVDLAAAYQLAAQFKWTDLIYTHFSARLPGSHEFLINPYGLMFDEITASSLVAVDVTPSRPVGEVLNSQEMPTNLPQGWNFEKVFGEDPSNPMIKASVDESLMLKLAMSDKPAPQPPQKQDRQPGIEDLVRSVEPDGGPLQRRWESLRSTLLRCNAVNRANGMAVNMMEQRVRLAISLLRQGSAATVAYGPAGTTVRSDARRRVTRA